MTPLCFLVDGLCVCPACISRDEMAGADPVFDIGDTEPHEYTCARCFERQCAQYASCDICDAEAAFPAVRALGALFSVRLGAACGAYIRRALLGASLVAGVSVRSSWDFCRDVLDNTQELGTDCTAMHNGSTGAAACWRSILDARGSDAAAIRAIFECSPSILACFVAYSSDDSRKGFSPKYRRARRRFARVIGRPHFSTISHECRHMAADGIGAGCW